jgi:signal transduction histidine kinase
VAQAARGQTPLLRELTARPDARDLVAVTRRQFLDEIADAGVSDATEIVRLLRAIESVESALADDAAQRLIGRLSGPEATQLVVEIAHDMRSPLGSILFLAEHLRSGRSGALNAIQARQLGLIYSAALGLNGMTSDVMELARGGERLASHAPIPFSVTEVIDSALAIVRPMAEEKGLELGSTIPDSDFRLGHPAALGRVLLNLITNALKFTAAGSVHVSVEPVDRTSLRFCVQDTGRGIPPHVLATLFDSFRRRTNHGYAFSSAGLGLAMCHKLVTAMGGELGVDTELEKGTRFHFQLELPPASRM